MWNASVMADIIRIDAMQNDVDVDIDNNVYECSQLCSAVWNR